MFYDCDLEVDSDEDGFYVKIDCGKWFKNRFRITDLDAFVDQVNGRIIPYLRERDEARRTLPVSVTLHQEYVSTMGDAHDISDPKHPQFHSVHADLWDNRDKTVPR